MGLAWACITSFFSFPTHTRAHFAHKLQKITKCFQCGYKIKTRLRYITHYAIFQNRHICADHPAIWLGALCGLCILPYIHGLQSALVSEYSLSGCLCGIGLYGRWVRESVSVFDGLVYFVGVDVKYIRHYKRKCKFICSL